MSCFIRLKDRLGFNTFGARCFVFCAGIKIFETVASCCGAARISSVLKQWLLDCPTPMRSNWEPVWKLYSNSVRNTAYVTWKGTRWWHVPLVVIAWCDGWVTGWIGEVSVSGWLVRVPMWRIGSVLFVFFQCDRYAWVDRLGHGHMRHDCMAFLSIRTCKSIRLWIDGMVTGTSLVMFSGRFSNPRKNETHKVIRTHLSPNPVSLSTNRQIGKAFYRLHATQLFSTVPRTFTNTCTTCHILPGETVSTL